MMTLKNGLSICWTVVLGCTLFLATVIGITLYFVPQYDVSEEHGKKNVEKKLSGTWVHSNTLCKGMVDYSDIVEYTFGESLDKSTVNPIHLDKYANNLAKASETEHKWAMEWISECGHIEDIAVDDVVVSLHHNNFIREVTFLYVPERSLVLARNDEGILSFVPKEILLGMPKYSAHEQIDRNLHTSQQDG